MPEAPATIVREPSYMSKEEPPTYEASYGHRPIEYCIEGEYTPSGAALPHHAVITPAVSDWTTSGSQSDQTRSHSDGRQTASCSPHDRFVRLTLPPLHTGMAITCLVCNFIVPGLGTIMAGFAVFCCTKRDKWTSRERCSSCAINCTIGVLQLILTPLFLLGWIWSILWGFAFVGTSNDEFNTHGAISNDNDPVIVINRDTDRVDRTDTDNSNRPARSPPPPYCPTELFTVGVQNPTTPNPIIAQSNMQTDSQTDTGIDAAPVSACANTLNTPT